MSIVNSVDPLARTANMIGIISFPLATTLSCAEVLSAKKALAPVRFKIISVMLPAGTLDAPSKTDLPTRLVRFTLVPLL